MITAALITDYRVGHKYDHRRGGCRSGDLDAAISAGHRSPVARHSVRRLEEPRLDADAHRSLSTRQDSAREVRDCPAAVRGHQQGIRLDARPGRHFVSPTILIKSKIL